MKCTTNDYSYFGNWLRKADLNWKVMYYNKYTYINKEWESSCYLTPNENNFSYILARTSYISMWCWWYPLCTRPTHLVEVLVLWNNSSRDDIPLLIIYSNSIMHAISNIFFFFHSDLIIPFSMESCFSHINVIERTYGKLWYTTVFDLTGLEPTICDTRDEHAHHYTTYTFHNNKEFTETLVKGNHTWLHWGTDKYVTWLARNQDYVSRVERDVVSRTVVSEN
jgi:hypothetical protein